MSDERSNNAEGSLQARIKNVAKAQRRSANDLFKQLYLERFLARLARSEHADQFIFKGGRLLAFLIDLGRETTDLDFMVTRLAAEEPVLREAFQEIAATPSDDGFAMTLVGIKPLVQAHMDYPGFRATIEIRLMNGKMRDRLQIDLGVGDLVTPAKKELGLLNHRGQALFEESISLLVYPVETIYAEKLETIISKGGLNSRMKDFHDLLLMGRQNSLMDLDRLEECVRSTFSHRGTDLQLPIDFIAPGWIALQSHWDRHRATVSDLPDAPDLPTEIKIVVAEINACLRRAGLITR